MSQSTSLQAEIAKLCGVSIEGLSQRSAAAVLRCQLAEEVLGVTPESPTTDSQKSFASMLGIKGLSAFKEIAALQIHAELVRQNEEAMEKHHFRPGMKVKFIGGPHIHDLTHKIGSVYTVSTVKPDGRIYFKATNGASAYASQLVPVA
jgi:hypothetical protein